MLLPCKEAGRHIEHQEVRKVRRKGAKYMKQERKVLDFLNRHQNASEVVMDEETGLPVKAVYAGRDVTGAERQEPAVYWFEGRSE